MNEYSATFPPAVDHRDLYAAVLAALPAPPDMPIALTAPNTITVRYLALVLSPAQITAFQNAAAAPPAPANAPYRNQDALAAQIAGALVRLRQIQTQAQTFGAQAPYGAATLGNLNDLLGKSQLIAAAVNDLATDLIGMVRILTNQFDGTT